jgi:amidase
MHPPTTDQIELLAKELGFYLSDREINYIKDSIENGLEHFQKLEELDDTDHVHAHGGRDTQGSPERDPYNAFVTHCKITEAEEGPISDYDVGLKDNIAVAGVEMTCGSKLMEGYIPKQDATVVRRLLESGASITGKLNMSALAYSATDVTATGPVKNPHDTSRSPGGSSNGSAVAVITEMVDAALGTDQGGSIRIPAAWTGCVGMKPTWGLVPYTGVQSLEDTIDHIGPLTRSVKECAQILTAISGFCPDDPRQSGLEIPSVDYAAHLDNWNDDLVIGILENGFQIPNANEQVCDTVRKAIETIGDTGIETRTVLSPAHDDALAVWNGIQIEGIAKKIKMEGVTPFTKTPVNEQLANYFSIARKEYANEYPVSMKVLLLMEEFISKNYNQRYYNIAMNLRSEISEAYEEIFEKIDILALPTAPTLPPHLSNPVDLDDRVEPMHPKEPNIRTTAPFNVTGHPAVSVPCGMVNDLPVGLQLVGGLFEDKKVLKTARMVESTLGVEVEVSA